MISPKEQLPSILEVLLFVAGEPLSISALAKHAGCSTVEAQEALSLLEKTFQTRGIRLLQKDELVSLVTAPHLASYAEHLIKEELLGDLSKASLETLTIIAYQHPITRADIDYIRGVNSSFTLRSLAQRGLIERLSGEGGKGYRYQPTMEFMKFLGITSFAELPEFETVQKELSRGVEQTVQKES
ncbi:MAG: SMC-Scp complex subunit ScpB [Candidatus Ryanbacteria bacterium RIFCSPHIGHO2_02_FULL_45_13b]|uniref:SMC-Scp complex subunit ScpB n=1 Tax=Candidatus Ryanbacteria bacterium RIFCSPHIGHO2_02_FULL_45_13b TaxID=1802117 RepID=A0A1G2G9K9_9BACT|nr:MAG: SMC-Scp complex subunit ScpB [Candidatus Ryanbacteria bacterium RIFCSPHIGHO2_02_FULL_45_13b]